jgi:hypothetical protein|tara:strand:- start:1330 stop:1542 length:213 start_codon:yes stop_codon:yes gene_type:complete
MSEEEISLSDLKEIKSILEERLKKKYRYMTIERGYDYEEYCKRELLYGQDVNYERLKRVNKRIEDFVNTI